LTRRREMGAITLLSLGFGLVGIDRFGRRRRLSAVPDDS
jgi:hypothetical protein